MSAEARNPKAVIENGQVYLRQPDGSYVAADRDAYAPAETAPSDAEIDRRIAADPDAAPDPTDEDLRRARIVRPYTTSENV